MISWPSVAIGALRKLYEPLQDIDIYVEDANDEAFYTHLLKRVGGNQVRVARVFSCGNRRAVIDKASSYRDQRPALFIIDGDLEWLVGDAAPPLRNLFRWNAYCVENFLICQKAATHVLMQDAAMLEDEAINALDFGKWVSSVEPALVELFSVFAAAHHFAPEIKTVSRGVGVMCDSAKKGGPATLSEDKVLAVRDEVMNALRRKVDAEQLAEFERYMARRFRDIRVPHRAVSGKDFMLPLLDFHLQNFGLRVRRAALRVRLAMACDMKQFDDLLTSMRAAARA